MITGLPGAPDVYASVQRMAFFPTAQLTSLADAQGGVLRGLLRIRGAHAGSTKVLASEGSNKTPTVYAGITSAVAFMGPKRRRPPGFYFSSMMPADAEALATNLLLSAHPASVSAFMAWPQAWESRPQTRETRWKTLEAQYEAAAWTAATTPMLPAMMARSISPLLVELAWSSEFLNNVPAWGGDWLCWARGGR